MASFTKKVNPRLAKRPLKTNERLANFELTSFVKEATSVRTLEINHLLDYTCFDIIIGECFTAV